jgi:hypothetical protein
MESPARIEHATARRVPSRSLAMGTVMVAVLQLNACSTGVNERTRAPSGKQSSPGIARPTYEVACSPPATRLSFVSTRRGMEQIYRMDIRRPQEVSRVTRLPGFATDHTWSPDGGPTGISVVPRGASRGVRGECGGDGRAAPGR